MSDLPASERPSHESAPRFSPRSFLRARRPERFSDSVILEESKVDRALLEFHLHSLTSRNQETEFARFALRLAAAEICPNLLPQTGPTGGGDSKVDSETYPVSGDLAIAWTVSNATEAASDRWAFAFSAKKDWRAKLQSDIAKLAGTGRGYSKAFFITNQFVKDKTRAELEDGLRKSHGIDVRILDLSWILDRVFNSKREQLAIDELGIQTELRRHVRQGPLDLQRQQDFEEIKARIEDAVRESRFTFQLVDDCIESAVLARGLDRPRTEVDGILDRAQRTAARCGTQHQRLVAAYQSALTAYWWHEDFERFVSLYGAAQSLAVGSDNAYDLELLTNLCMLHHTLVAKGLVNGPASDFAERHETLLRELARLEHAEDRPSTAQYARTLRLEMELVVALPGDADHVLGELEAVVRASQGLIGFPLAPLCAIVTELGDALCNRPAYNRLLDAVIEVTSDTEGDVAAARMNLRRGVQQLDEDQPYEAIRYLGRALAPLYRDECQRELACALYMCGCAYERVGLLWAARGTVLTASSIAANEYWTLSKITPLQAACFIRMKWLEIQLGRLPHTLAWHEVDAATQYALEQGGYHTGRTARTDKEFDAILGILILRAELWDLRSLTMIPDVLERMGLALSALSLVYALGHEDRLPKGLREECPSPDALKDFFSVLCDQPATRDLPPKVVLYEQQRVVLLGNVVGCEVQVDSDNVSPCVELSEWIVASLESLLSTRLLDGVTAREPHLTINVRLSHFGEAPFSYDVKERDGRPHVEVSCGRFAPAQVPPGTQAALKSQLSHMLVQILPRVFMIADTAAKLEEWLIGECALDRAIHFTSGFVTLANVLGRSPKTSIDLWLKGDEQMYPLSRTTEWDAEERRAARDQAPTSKPPNDSNDSATPATAHHDLSRASHREIRTVSLIREPLWNEARWIGVAYLHASDESEPPTLALMFSNKEAAETIFADWNRDLGDRDARERLRIAILRGIDRKEPKAYRVIIGSNPHSLLNGGTAKLVAMISRLHTMRPENPGHLDRFLEHLARHGEFKLACAVGNPGTREISLLKVNQIVKRELHVRHAWQIGVGDIDACGITPQDDPIIPPDQVEAPIKELLQSRQEARKPGGDRLRTPDKNQRFKSRRRRRSR